MNHIELVGALVQEAELRYTPGGVAILEVTLAGRREHAWYHRVTMFGKRGEPMAELPIGTVLHVVGRLEHQTWEKDGEKRSTVKIIADNIGVTDGEVGADGKGQPILENAVNRAVIAGNLTRDPEPRETKAGTVTNFTLAINERHEDTAHFIDVAAWNMEIPGSKGDALVVNGEWRTRSFENKEGQRVYRSEVNARRVSGPVSRSGTPKRSTPAPSSTRLDIDEEFPPEGLLPF